MTAFTVKLWQIHNDLWFPACFMLTGQGTVEVGIKHHHQWMTNHRQEFLRSTTSKITEKGDTVQSAVLGVLTRRLLHAYYFPISEDPVLVLLTQLGGNWLVVDNFE